jgi:hypothetical protein
VVKTGILANSEFVQATRKTGIPILPEKTQWKLEFQFCPGKFEIFPDSNFEHNIYIEYIHWRSQRTFMYLNQLGNTDIDYSRKLELVQRILLVLVIWRPRQINTSLAIIRDIRQTIIYLNIIQRLRYLENSITYSSNFQQNFEMFKKNLSLVSKVVWDLFSLLRNYGKRVRSLVYVMAMRRFVLSDFWPVIFYPVAKICTRRGAQNLDLKLTLTIFFENMCKFYNKESGKNIARKSRFVFQARFFNWSICKKNLERIRTRMSISVIIQKIYSIYEVHDVNSSWKDFLLEREFVIMKIFDDSYLHVR